MQIVSTTDNNLSLRLTVAILGFLGGLIFFQKVVPDINVAFTEIGLLILLLSIRDRTITLWVIAGIAFNLGWVYQVWVSDNLFILPKDWLVIEWLGVARRYFENNLGSVLPASYADLAKGLVVGTKSGFDKQLKEIFINAGVIHIVAISGFNVTIVIKIFCDAIRGQGRWPSFIFGTLAIIGFAVLVGGQASVVRAAIMGWLFLLARFCFRQTYILSALLFSAWIMVLFSPKILFNDIGFLLSFGAMAGMIFLSPLLIKLIIKSKLGYLLPSFVISVLVETLSAQIIVMPLLWHYFGRISLVSPIANLLILPVIIIPMALGAVIGLTAGVIPLLAQVLAYPLFLILSWIIGVSRFMAELPFAGFQLEKISWQTMLIIYLCGAGLYFKLKQKVVRKFINHS